MMTIDFESAEECKQLSKKMYNENRCFESYGIYLAAPPRKPSNFDNIIDLYIKRVNHSQGRGR